MVPPIVDQLLGASHDQVESLLKEFNAKHAQIFTFPDLSLDDRQRLVSWMIEVVSSERAKESCQVRCLETLRLLSRDRCHLEEVFSADVLASLARVAQLTGRPSEELGQVEHLRAPVVVEALKTLCNLIYNSAMVQQTCSHNGCVEGVMLRLKLYVHPDLPHDVKFFDMRMLFLLTALCADTRPRLRTELHGLIYLRETLDLVLKLSEERTAAAAQSSPGPKRCMRLSRRGRHGGDPVGGPTVVTPVLSTEEASLAAEVLKVLYNLTCSLDKFHVEEEDEVHFERLVGLLHDLLLCDVANVETKDQLHGQVVHLLSSVPRSSYAELLTEASSGEEGSFEGYNIDAVAVLVAYLERRLDEVEAKPSFQRQLTPVLLCLAECGHGHRILRRYLRSRVLPPLNDVMNRPESGNTLRNRMVRLMTVPCTDTKHLAAELLFVLCKEKVGRLVKYTGYGNAAGLLARRGLLLGGARVPYSSDSEDSDTEEYLRNRDEINPVLGCYQPTHDSPLQGLSQEQKEHEAMQLVSLMDQLARGGIVQPARVGADGRPHPIEHMLELQEDRDLTESASD
ncbi:ric8 guanine nucleotide exchange factor A isoform X2 [Dermacentor variabilis]|uniref:ric8 guanine nucleotide exchange factor A isoform X2 n=1 Tax=Dermacentor variabilis TaxID=34621 RepID=UPI003F5BC017